METNPSDQSPIDEPNSKRLKLETDSSTSSKSKINDDCPILTLPADILAKIIAYLPIAQWPALELLYDFREATLIAWRQLRNVNVNREFLIKCENAADRFSFFGADIVGDRSSFGKSLVSILQKLVECSPFLTSISGIDFRSANPEFNLDAIQSLAQFKHLQSITLGDRRGKIPFDAVVEFLELTRSRTNLKELRLLKIKHLDDHETFIERFASSFSSGQEIQLPLRLEKFAFSQEYPHFILLDTMDTSRLSDLHLANAWIEPQQLTNLIDRASNLRLIEFSVLHCGDLFDGDDNDFFEGCDGPRLEDNKKLLLALASHGNLTALKFDCKFEHGYGCDCLHLEQDFVQMLKAIGGRGNLRKLAIEQFFISACNINMDELCATIRNYIPYLQSLKLYADVITEGIVSNVIALADLQELDFAPSCTDDNDDHTPAAMTIAIEEIVSLPSLKRLALDMIPFDDMTSRMCLAAATSLTDLRILDGDLTETDFFEKWSDRFACSLQVLMVAGITEVLEEGDSRDEDDTDNQQGLVRLLEKTIRLRVLILRGCITDRVLATIAKSCSHLEVFGVDPRFGDINVGLLQGIVIVAQN